MPSSNRVFNAIYHRYIGGAAQVYLDARRTGATCREALTAARDYSERKGGGR